MGISRHDFGLSQYFCWFGPPSKRPNCRVLSVTGVPKAPWAVLRSVESRPRSRRIPETGGKARMKHGLFGKIEGNHGFCHFLIMVPIIFPLKPLKGQGISPHLQRSLVTNPQAEEPGGIRSRIHPVESGLSKLSVHRQPVLMGTQKVPQLFS
jgi:hypothetical protein